MINIFDMHIQNTVIIIVLTFIFGAVMGRFSLFITTNSQSLKNCCTVCGKKFKTSDIIPILGYLFSGRKCRFCKSKISPKYLFVELSTALLYTLSICVLGVSTEMIYAIVLMPVLVAVSTNDIEKMEIPYSCSLTIAIIGIVSIFTDGTPWHEHLLGAVIIGIPFVLLAMSGAIGGGDVQLMTAAGLLLGWRIIPAAVIGIATGAAGGGIILALSPNHIKKENSDTIMKIASEWYNIQNENGIYICDDKSVVIHGRIYKGVFETECNNDNSACWSAYPDTKLLCTKLNQHQINDFAVSITIEKDGVKDVRCQKQIVFGPYLSSGIAVAYLFGEQIISGYLNII